jgi:hypothetical protein
VVGDVESLLGAFALDALSLGEERRVADALAADPVLRAEADSLLAVAAVLAEAAVGPSDRAPAGLWAKIAAATAPAAPARAKARRAAWQRRLGAAVAAAAVAAAAVVSVVAVRQHIRISDFEQDPLAAAAAAAREQRGSRVVSLTGSVAAEVVLAADGTGYLLAPDAPQLPADETYQLWAIVGDRVISAGVLGAAPGIAAFHMSGDVAGFALTIEAAGGVVASEQEPVAFGLVSG